MAANDENIDDFLEQLSNQESFDPVPNPHIAPSSPDNIRGGSFGWTRNDGEKPHWGLDIAASVGTPFTPINRGVIVEMRTDVSGYVENSFGNYIVVRTDTPEGSHWIKYCHLDHVDPAIVQYYVDSKINNTEPIVDENTILGLSGKTGNAYNVENKHIHIEVYEGKFDKDHRVDPEDYLKTKFDSDGNPIKPETDNPLNDVFNGKNSSADPLQKTLNTNSSQASPGANPQQNSAATLNLTSNEAAKDFEGFHFESLLQSIEQGINNLLSNISKS